MLYKTFCGGKLHISSDLSSSRGRTGGSEIFCCLISSGRNGFTLILMMLCYITEVIHLCASQSTGQSSLWVLMAAKQCFLFWEDILSSLWHLTLYWKHNSSFLVHTCFTVISYSLGMEHNNVFAGKGPALAGL